MTSLSSVEPLEVMESIQNLARPISKGLKQLFPLYYFMASNTLKDNQSTNHVTTSVTSDITSTISVPVSGAIIGELRSRNVRLTVYLEGEGYQQFVTRFCGFPI